MSFRHYIYVPEIAAMMSFGTLDVGASIRTNRTCRNADRTNASRSVGCRCIPRVNKLMGLSMGGGAFRNTSQPPKPSVVFDATGDERGTSDISPTRPTQLLSLWHPTEFPERLGSRLAKIIRPLHL